MNHATEPPAAGDEQESLENGTAPEEAAGNGESLPSEQRTAFDSTRRVDEHRRRIRAPFAGEERRAGADRRTGGDRRAMTCEVSCKTSGAVDSIENWLDEHCQGEWQVVFQGMDDEFITKSLRIMFELKSDRDSFFAIYLKRRP